MSLINMLKKTALRVINIVCLAVLLANVGGCDKVNDLLSGEMVPPGLIMLKQDISLQRVMILSDKGTNAGRSFAFHVVLTKNLQMAKELSDMDAKSYFEADKAGEFHKNYHGMFKIFKFSVIPGKKMPEQKLRVDPGSKYLGGYFFAKLQHPQGKNRIRIPPSTHVIIKFTKDGMALVTPDLESEGLEALQGKIGVVPGLGD